MITMTSTEVRQNFGEFLEKGSRQPIIIKRQNREIGAFVPMEEYQKLRQLQRQELDQAITGISQEAKANGLTEALLQDILTEVNPS
ncbi:MAG: type II toxin-antitoxin system Phd/YefM family antitoxin [Verrucomicrobiota bacterium]